VIVKRDARERWAEVLAAIVEVLPAPGGAVVPAEEMDRRRRSNAGERERRSASSCRAALPRPGTDHASRRSSPRPRYAHLARRH